MCFPRLGSGESLTAETFCRAAVTERRAPRIHGGLPHGDGAGASDTPLRIRRRRKSYAWYCGKDHNLVVLSGTVLHCKPQQEASSDAPVWRGKESRLEWGQLPLPSEKAVFLSDLSVFVELNGSRTLWDPRNRSLASSPHAPTHTPSHMQSHTDPLMYSHLHPHTHMAHSLDHTGMCFYFRIWF